MAELIDKWEVVNKLIQLENNYVFYKEKWDADVLYRRICELEIGIGKTPTVDAVEVVHGRWIWTVTGEEDYEQYYRCSKCNDHMYSEYNYCPNCGAKMDGEARNEARNEAKSEA